MRDAPSAELTDLLARLGLATPAQVKGARRFANSLGKGIPLFDSVWVDALVRKRMLTPYQAAEINAGRGASLGLGSLVLMQTPENLGYAQQFIARDVNEQKLVAATLATPSSNAPQQVKQLKEYAEQLARAHQAEMARQVLPLEELGETGGRLWIKQPLSGGRSVGEWLLRGGRLPGEVVLELARQMAQALAELEQFSLVHGDISASSVHISEQGEIRLLNAGLRSVVRPAEGYAHADMPAEAYDYLAPERIAEGIQANAQTDLFACGCLWWQMLTGRPPLAGGDSLAKIKAAHASRIVDINRYAPEAPAILKDLIIKLTSREPAERSESFAELAGHLGASTQAGRNLVARHWASISARSLQYSTSLLAEQKPPVTEQLQSYLTPLGRLWPGHSRHTDQAVAEENRLGLIRWGFLWAQRFLQYKRMATAALGVLSLILSAWSLWWNAPSDPVEERQGRASATEQGQPHKLSEMQIAGAEPLLATQNQAADQQHGVGQNRVQLASGIESERNPLGLGSALDRAIAAERNNPYSTFPAERYEHQSQSGDFQEIVLPTDRIVQASTLEIHPGMRLSPPAGRRATIQVPPGGWVIDVEQLRMENVDFLPAGPAGEPSQVMSESMIRLQATSAQFHGCTFQVPAAQQHERLAAIRWSRPTGERNLDRLPPAGHLLLANCILAEVHTGIDSQMTGPVVLELDNVLFAAPADAAHAGTLWRMDHCPKAEDDFILRMNACTLRDSMSLLDVYCPELPASLGQIRFDARDCVFVPRSSGALLRVIGPYRPDRLMEQLVWEGQGSLLPSEGRFGLWYDAQGSPHAIDDVGVSIDGLVRGGIEFSGTPSIKSTDSVLTHWAAPLLGDSRPGVRAAALPAVTSKPY